MYSNILRTKPNLATAAIMAIISEKRNKLKIAKNYLL